MEAFANQPGVQTVWANEIKAFENGGARAVVTAIVLENGSNRMRGVKVELANGPVTMSSTSMRRRPGGRATRWSKSRKLSRFPG
jgi:hypothetical protein